ncbi:MAG: hypothetical protein NG737_07410 [Omnitrophica bacterium]|nr:hypothetical protein [Candidatus Omnitrophota bacterium]
MRTLHNKLDSPFLSSNKRQLIILLITYISLVTIFSFANRYFINPDGVSYMRLAGYIAEGNFQQSVSGHWSPLISWCLAPFMLFGIEGVTAARIVLSLSGLVLLLGSWLLAKRFNLVYPINFVALLITALLIVSWSKGISPDLLMTAFLICYLYGVTDPNILTKKKLAFSCGVFAGLAYLSKHYALPFFLIHFPLIVVLRGYFYRDASRILNKKVFTTLFIGLITFLVIASPLIISYSVKYNRLTIGTAGIHAHAAVGPDVKITKARFRGLRQPKSYAINTWEYPIYQDNLEDFKTWSPFENKKYFKHQVKVALSNTNLIYKFFVNNYFIIGILSICFLPFAFFIKRMGREKRFLYGWVIITIILYCSGYIMVYLPFDSGKRYFYIIYLIVLLLSFNFIQEIIKNVRTEQTVNLSNIRNLKVYIVLLAVLSFSLSPTIDFYHSVKKITDKQSNIYKRIADRLSSVEFYEPYAIVGSGSAKFMGLYVAYYSKKKFLGRPNSTDIEGITKEVKAAGAKSIIVLGSMKILENLKNDEKYRHIIKLKKGELGWDAERNEYIEEINVFYVN